MRTELPITFELNGQQVESTSLPERRLVDVLREELSLMGPKIACGEGECGACTVLLDGGAVLSCIMAVGAVEGRSVVTIEGLRQTVGFQILAQAFNDAGAVQCGFCTPGIIMTAYALLRDNPAPDESEIKVAISGNLCRCTGYNMIFEAISLASLKKEDQW